MIYQTDGTRNKLLPINKDMQESEVKGGGGPREQLGGRDGVNLLTMAWQQVLILDTNMHTIKSRSILSTQL